MEDEDDIVEGKAKKEKKKKGANRSAAAAEGSSKQTAATSSHLAGTSNAKDTEPADDSSWTRVESRRRTAANSASHSDVLTSDTTITTSVTDNTETSSDASDKTEEESIAQPEKRKTFVEKMLPKPRKTGVEE